MRSSEQTIPPSGAAPPAKPEPPPRAVSGTSCVVAPGEQRGDLVGAPGAHERVGAARVGLRLGRVAERRARHRCLDVLRAGDPGELADQGRHACHPRADAPRPARPYLGPRRARLGRDRARRRRVRDAPARRGGAARRRARRRPRGADRRSRPRARARRRRARSRTPRGGARGASRSPTSSAAAASAGSTSDVDGRALIPRPETEHLVEAALSLPRGATVVDVGTGSGAVALALKDERPDLEVTGTDASADALAVARANGARLGLEVRWREGDLLAGVATADAVVSNPPYVAVGARVPAELGFEPVGALLAGRDRLRGLRAARAGRGRDRRALRRVRGRHGPGGRGRRAAARRRLRRDRGRPRPRRDRPGGGRAPMSADARALEACVAGGGVAVFSADTVYGLACDPENGDAVARLYALKGRPPRKPSAVMWFSAAAALDALPELGPRTRARLRGAAARRRDAARAQPARALPARLRPARSRSACACRTSRRSRRSRGPVLQSSANLAGAPDARRLDDVPASIRDGADLVLDGGELAGHAVDRDRPDRVRGRAGASRSCARGSSRPRTSPPRLVRWRACRRIRRPAHDRSAARLLRPPARRRRSRGRRRDGARARPPAVDARDDRVGELRAAGGPRVPGQRAHQQVRRGLPGQALLRRLRVRRRRSSSSRSTARRRCSAPSTRTSSRTRARRPTRPSTTRCWTRATRSWASRCRTAATSRTG